VLLPPNLTTIFSRAFYFSGLSEGIVIPESVARIHFDSFSGISEGVFDLTAHAPGSITEAPWGIRMGVIRWHPSGNDNSSYFVFNKETGRIAGLKEDYSGDGNILIPNSIDGVTVTGFSDGAFASRPSNQLLRTMTFEHESHITVVPDNTFWGARFLTSIELPDQVTRIGNRAFQECWTLASVRLPADLTTLGSQAFSQCNALDNVVLPDGLRTIPDSAFSSCINLKNITWPENLQTIQRNAFFRTGFTSIIFPDGLRSLDANSLSNMPNLESVTFPGAAINTISASAFSGNPQLQNIYLEQKDRDSVSSAPWGAVHAMVHWRNDVALPAIVIDDTGIWEYNTNTGRIMTYLPHAPRGNDVELFVPATLYYQGIPTRIVSVGDSAAPGSIIAGNNRVLGSVTIADGIETIENGAFVNVSIGRLDLGNTVTSIGRQAFAFGRLVSLTLPDSLNRITSGAFRDNALNSVIILPGNLEFVDDGVFLNNPNIEQVTIMMNRRVACANFRLAPPAVRDNQPWGLGRDTLIVWMDDTRPIVHYDVISIDTENNCVTLYIRTIMTNVTEGVRIVHMESRPGMPELENVWIAPDNTEYSSATMTITHEFGNGSYSFNVYFTEEGHNVPGWVSINLFTNITYDGNGNTDGAVPVGGIFVQGMTPETADTGDLRKAGTNFTGWNTRSDGSGISYSPGDIISTAIPREVTLYAQWEAISFSAPLIDFGAHPLTGRTMWHVPVNDPVFHLSSGFLWTELRLECTPFAHNGSIGALPVNGRGSTDLFNETVLRVENVGRDENNDFIWRLSDFLSHIDIRAKVAPGARTIGEVYQSEFTWTFIND